MPSGPELAEYFGRRLDAQLDFIRELVELESPTHDKPAVDRLGRRLAHALGELGAEVTVAAQAEVGDHLRAVFPGRDRSRRVLVASHMDTVYPLGQLAAQPIREDGERLYGPGIFDMKAGIAQAVFALQAFVELGHRPACDVVFWITSDEETGSATSRALLEDEARRSVAALITEPAAPPDFAVKTARKGVGMFTLRITGRAAHAGADHAQGVSAVEELAHQVLRLHGLTDDATGTTVNVGVVSGGTRRNVVAAAAEALVDLRVTSAAEGDRATRAILGLEPVLAGARIEVTGGLNRPPMERTPAIARLYEHARGLAAELGFELPEGASGGGSDGNFTAALGVPTLDGLGACGHGAHSLEEHILPARLPERTALLFRLLDTVGTVSLRP